MTFLTWKMTFRSDVPVDPVVPHTPDQRAQLKQLHEHAVALRIDIDAAEVSGAAVPAIHDARELLNAAMAKAAEAILHGRP